VNFNGQLLTWVLVTNSENSKTTSTSSPSASAASPKCTPIGGVAAGSRMEDAGSVDQMLSSKVQVYPNPVSSRVVVKSASSGLKSADIAVFDVQGKQYKVAGSRQVNAFHVELDMTNLPSGIYMIRVQSVDGAKLFRVVKQ
jgi:hypothetical protein